MNEILNVMKQIFTFDKNEKTPIGLCAFEQSEKKVETLIIKQKRNKEIRLSELMEG